MKQGEQNQFYAIKIVEPKDGARLEREASNLRDLAGTLLSTRTRSHFLCPETTQCPGVPKLVAFEATSDRSCLVTTPAGKPVTALILENGFLALKDCFRYGRELIHLLETIHNAGFIHCDVHPGNFVVNDSGRVVLIDWELAQRQRSSAPLTTLCGVGPYLYISFCIDALEIHSHPTLQLRTSRTPFCSPSERENPTHSPHEMI